MPIEEVREVMKFKLIQMSIRELLKFRIRMIFSNKDGLINYSLELFREMVRRNYKRMLNRIINRKLIAMCL